MAYLRIQTGSSCESVRLYESRSQLRGTRAARIWFGGREYYVQAVGEDEAAELSACRNRGSGTAAAFIGRDGRKVYICRAAYSRSYTALYTFTSGTSITVPKSRFARFGGVILLCGGKGGAIPTERAEQVRLSG